MKVATYTAKPGGHIRDEDAEKIGNELERRFGDRPITPADFVSAAKSRRSPLHGYIEWDDSLAAGRYREDQARSLMRSIVVTYAGDERPRKAFHNVVVVQKGDVLERAYAAERVVWSSPDLAVQVVDRARRELELWTARYEEYEELSDSAQHVRRALEAVAA